MDDNVKRIIEILQENNLITPEDLKVTNIRAIKKRLKEVLTTIGYFTKYKYISEKQVKEHIKSRNENLQLQDFVE